MSQREVRTLAVEGVIGVGKTSLAQAIADCLGAELLSEDSLPNPFLARFYKQRSRWALACQLTFLTQRLKQFRRPQEGVVVADHTIDKELLFAQVVMEADEYAVYESIYKQLAVDCAFNPQVIVYLTADATTLLERIRERGRDMEGAIDLAYLERLHHNYHGWFTNHAADSGRRVVVVDADGHFIARDSGAVQRLLEACRLAPPGVSYCNPFT